MSGYGDDAGMQEWLEANGLTLPPAAPPIAVLRNIGSEFLDAAYEHALFCSSRTGGFEQERAWPRTGHTVNGVPVPDALIPMAWIKASYRVGYLEATKPGWATQGRDPSRLVKRQKAGEVEREFFGIGEGAAVSRAATGFNIDPLVDGAILGWLCEAPQMDGPNLGVWVIG